MTYPWISTATACLTYVQKQLGGAKGAAAITSIATLLLLTACNKETLFQSNFDSTPVNDPPAAAQAVGAAKIDGPPGSVVVVAPPVQPSGRWVEIRRPTADSPVAGFQGNFAQARGDGDYTFSSTLFIPDGSGIATIQFEQFGQPVGNPVGFLHIDFMPNNRVRIDDNDTTIFGSFPRNQPFIVQITLHITSSGANAHIILSGANASGDSTYNLPTAMLNMARQFGAVRVWIGFPNLGKFDATNIAVSRKKT